MDTCLQQHPFDGRPDDVITHVGTTDALMTTNDEGVTNSIIEIKRNCRACGVSKIFISSIVKKNPKLNAITVQASDALRDLYNSNGFYVLCNDVITSDYLCQDQIHLKDVGAHILRGTVCKFL